MNKQMPIGVDDFQKVVRNYYFVDKSNFIKNIIDHHSRVTLITRPRRFGKTLNMSMLEYYFSIDKKAESKGLFEKLKINQYGEKYQAEKNKYPVIFLSFKEIAGVNWEEMQEYIAYFFAALFLRFNKLKEELNAPQEKALFEKIQLQKGNITETANAIKLLMSLLEKHYHKKVIVLIDEYDAPFQKARENGFFKEAISFFLELLSNALKENASLYWAILTGVSCTEKEHILDGINTVDVCSVTTSKYDSAFGYTQKEVEKICSDLILTEKLPEIKKWYDGYCFGKTKIYNPWSINSYISHGCTVKPYWINTSGNSILRHLTSKESKQNLQLQNLFEGKEIEVPLVYGDIDRNSNALYNLLLITGYLTIAAQSMANSNRFFLKIPNNEIKWAFRKEILEHLISGVDGDIFYDMFEYMSQGKAKQFQETLQTIIQGAIDTFDTADKECFYRGLMLGISALFWDKKYTVQSHKKNGSDKFNLALLPQSPKKPAITMEFRISATESALERQSLTDRNQIESKTDNTNIQTLGNKTIWNYDVFICKKKICVKSKFVSLCL